MNKLKTTKWAVRNEKKINTNPLFDTKREAKDFIEQSKRIVADPLPCYPREVHDFYKGKPIKIEIKEV